MESIPEKTPILIVDDDEGLLFSIRAALLSAGLPEPALLSDSRKALELVRRHRFHLLMLDLIMPYLDGMEVLRQVKQAYPDIECIIVTAVDDVEMAVKAIKFGAYDYLVKPLDLERTTITINHALERYQLKQGIALYERPPSFDELAHQEAFAAMVAEDELMALVFRQAEICARSDYNVLITGETGVGKGMLARIIHRLSRRSDRPFVQVNMPSFARGLFEDEFFGHVRGAYTGAFKNKKGFFETALGGTLFLDEITELELHMQGKLLQVIEDKFFYRLGSTDAVNVDVRLISASNQDVKAAVSSGKFRGDLYFRLNEYHIHIPPLRKRTKDILPLARHFLRIHSKRNGKSIIAIDEALERALLAYNFPGNVRELENMIASAVLAETSSSLRLSSVPSLNAAIGEGAASDSALVPLEQVKRRHVERVLAATGGNRTRAAKILGIGLRTLQRYIKSYGLTDRSS